MCVGGPSPRYKTTVTPSAYGKLVFSQLSSVKASLQKQPPNRKGWFRIIKDTCDFITAVRKKQISVPEEEPQASDADDDDDA